MKTIGEYIRESRKKAHLTQEELAKKTNLSRSHIGAIETNRYNPSLSTLQLIANAVGVDVSFFLGGQPVPTVDIPKGETVASVILGSKDKDSPSTDTQYAINPPPEFYSNPETQRRMEEIWNDPKRQRIFIASKDLQPEELDKIADLMETIIAARKGH